MYESVDFLVRVMVMLLERLCYIFTFVCKSFAIVLASVCAVESRLHNLGNLTEYVWNRAREHDNKVMAGASEQE